jgi:hypothetical protein
VKKYGPTIDVVAKRYGDRPSQVVAFDEEYNSYYCFQFNLAVAGTAMLNEATAQKKAYAEAEEKAKQNSASNDAPKSTNKENPAFTKEYREHIKKVQSEITVDGSGSPKKLNHEAIFKKMNDFNSKGKRVNIDHDPHI